MPDYKTGKSILNAKNSLIQMAGLTLEEIVQIASSLESNERGNYGDLILKRSQIGKEGAKALAKALENNSPLNALHLLGNSPIGNEGAKFLAVALEKNSNLRELDLRSNEITDEGARAFIASLEKNKTLTILNLDNNTISQELITTLNTLLERNQQREKKRLNVLADIKVIARSIKPVNFNNLTLPKTPNYALAAYDDYRVCVSGSNRFVRPVEVDSERAAFTVGKYSESKIELSNRIVQTLKNMPRMHCVKEDIEKGEFTFVQKTGFLGFLEKGFFGFPDWIDIKVVSCDEKDTTSSFIMLSRSQYGHSDFGLNKERVQYCLDLINKVDSSVTFSPYLPFTKSQHALAGAIASFAIAAIILAVTGIVWPIVLGGALGVALVGGLLAVHFIPAAPSPIITPKVEHHKRQGVIPVEPLYKKENDQNLRDISPKGVEALNSGLEQTPRLTVPGKRTKT